VREGGSVLERVRDTPSGGDHPVDEPAHVARTYENVGVHAPSAPGQVATGTEKALVDRRTLDVKKVRTDGGRHCLSGAVREDDAYVQGQRVAHADSLCKQGLPLEDPYVSPLGSRVRCTGRGLRAEYPRH
jgi:hypothetical protein